MDKTKGYKYNHIIMYKQIRRAINTLKHMFCRRYIDIATTKNLNKRGILAFY